MTEVAFFASTVNAMLVGDRVRATVGASFEFASGTDYLWMGFGQLSAGGHIWKGAGELGTISDFELGPGVPTNSINFTLSQIDVTIAAAARSQQTEVKNRRARIWLMFFDENWQLLDAPYCVRSVVMDRMLVTIDNEKGEGTIEVVAEPLMSGKHIPPFGYLTNLDQQAKYPGDRGLERTSLASRTVTWG